jgi:DNA-binding CsgD family transcriptional regulator
MEAADLIGQIYESVGDPDAFARTLIRVAQLAHSPGAQFGLVDRAGRWVRSAVVGLDQSQLPLYVNHYAADDPRRPYFNKHPGQWIFSQQAIVDPVSFEHSALVNEFLDKNDARHAMYIAFPVGPHHSVALSLMRSRRKGQFSEKDASKLTPLLPHIKRAMSLHIRIGRLESTLESLNAVVDQLSTPVLLVDRGCRLRFANSSGQEELRRGQYLLLRSERVQPSNGRHAPHLAKVLEAALLNDPAAPLAEQGASMRLLDDLGHSAILIVQELRGQAALHGMPQADAALFLIRREGQPVNPRRLQVAFNLTPAETRLAHHLISGKALEEIGEKLHVSRETLKSQLRSLFSKTDTRRQGELISRLIVSVSVSLGY